MRIVLFVDAETTNIQYWLRDRIEVIGSSMRRSCGLAKCIYATSAICKKMPLRLFQGSEPERLRENLAATSVPPVAVRTASAVAVRWRAVVRSGFSWHGLPRRRIVRRRSRNAELLVRSRRPVVALISIAIGGTRRWLAKAVPATGLGVPANEAAAHASRASRVAESRPAAARRRRLRSCAWWRGVAASPVRMISSPRGRRETSARKLPALEELLVARGCQAWVRKCLPG